MSAGDYIFLLELTGYTDASTSVVYRYATEDWCTERVDTLVDTFYDGRVAHPGMLSRQMFDGGVSGMRSTSRSEMGFGSVVLRNDDGALDAVFAAPGISFRERKVECKRVARGSPYSTAVLVYRATIAQVSNALRETTVSIKDRMYELDSAHISTTYAGTNSLPNGVEGVADLAGKRKPIIYGKVFQIAPPCVNTSRLIYQVSTAAIQSGTVYQGRLALTAGADYTSQADMEATAPAAGQVRWWPAGGMFRLGSAPTYPITADVVADTAANSTAAQILKRLALARGIDAGDISSADVTALDTANSAVLGIYVDDERTTLDAMDEIARSVGVYYGFDRTGVLRMARVDLPGTTSTFPVADWTTARITSLTTGEDVPAGTVRVKYARYYATAQISEMAGSVTDAAKNDYREEWRVSTATPTISPNPHKRLLETIRETCLTAKADADTEAARVAAITDEPLYSHLAEGVQFDPDAMLALDLNLVVEVFWSRYGYSREGGEFRRVIAINNADYKAGRCDLVLWGA